MHVDDPRTSRFKLPSWRQCIGCKPSEIVLAQIDQIADSGSSILESQTTASDLEIPPLEGDEDVDKPKIQVQGLLTINPLFLVSLCGAIFCEFIPSLMLLGFYNTAVIDTCMYQ